MINELIEILSYSFIQRALIAAVLIGFIGSYFGVFVVQKKISFIGSGIAHSAFGGVALGLYLGVEPLYVTIPFTLFIAYIFTILKRKTTLSFDSVIGIIFAFSFAIGTILLSSTTNFVSDAFSYLFGSILSVNKMDIVFISFLALVTLMTTYKLWGIWAYTGYDVELAKAMGINSEKYEMMLTMLITLTIVISIKIVGIVLISAYLVIPAAIAALISNTFYKMTFVSIVTGILSSVIGLLVAITLDFPVGAVIIVLQTFILFFIVIFQKLFKKS